MTYYYQPHYTYGNDINAWKSTTDLHEAVMYGHGGVYTEREYERLKARDLAK